MIKFNLKLVELASKMLSIQLETGIYVAGFPMTLDTVGNIKELCVIGLYGLK